MFSSDFHLLKAPSPMDRSPSGKITSLSKSHRQNVNAHEEGPNAVMPSGRFNSLSEVRQNANLPILRRVEGRRRCLNDSQQMNVFSPTSTTPSLSTTSSKTGLHRNASAGISFYGAGDDSTDDILRHRFAGLVDKLLSPTL